MEFLRPELDALAAYHTPLAPGADKLNENEWPEDLPEHLKQKLGLLFEQELATNRYPSADPGALKAEIAHYAGLTPQMVSLGNGSDELIRSVILATCLGGRGAVASAEPTFSMYGILARTLGVPYVPLERSATDFSVALGSLRRAVGEMGVRVIFLANPNSPTGTPLPPEALPVLRELPALIVIDEAYFEFSGLTAAPLIPEWPNLIVLRTFSKAFRLAGLRVGYALATLPLAAALEKVRLPYNLSALSQRAALLALQHRDELLAGVPALLAERDRIAAFLAARSDFRVWPSATNFVFAHPLTRPSEEIRAALAERGSLVRATGGGLRITAGTPAQNDRLLANLTAVLG